MTTSVKDRAMFRIGHAYMSEQETMGHNIIVETYYDGFEMRYQQREARN